MAVEIAKTVNPIHDTDPGEVAHEIWGGLDNYNTAFKSYVIEQLVGRLKEQRQREREEHMENVDRLNVEDDMFNRNLLNIIPDIASYDAIVAPTPNTRKY